MTNGYDTRVAPGAPERVDPRAALRVLWRWKLLFLAILIAAPVITYLVVRNSPKVYESATTVSVASTTVSTGGSNSGSFSTSNIQAIAALIPTRQVAAVAARLLSPPVDPGSIASGVTASADIQTGFITITVQADDPRRAAAIANAFAAALGVNQTNAAITEIDRQISILKRQLAGTPPGTATAATRQQLQQQIAQLTAARGSQNGNVTVIQPATPQSTPISPHVRRSVELGLVIGMLLAIGVVALAENSDRRIHSPSDLEEVTRLPLLSAVPGRAFSAPMDSMGIEEEAFQMLRAALTYFNIDRRMSTVVITSAAQKDGKTTVAIRLALATARAGKHVLLIDADLRRSQVSERLGLQARAGLGAVLVGETTLGEALREYPVETTKGGRLQILPAGEPPPNPSELLSSDEMRNLLRDLESRTDLVIVDTPAALAVSDTMPLLQLASGVVLVARSNSTTRDAIKRLQSVITNAGGTIVGIVATGTGSGPGYEDYGYRYVAQASRRWPFARRRPKVSALADPAAGPTPRKSSEA